MFSIDAEEGDGGGSAVSPTERDHARTGGEARAGGLVRGAENSGSCVRPFDPANANSFTDNDQMASADSYNREGKWLFFISGAR